MNNTINNTAENEFEQITLSQIRSDLKEVRYYHANKSIFAENDAILQKVKTYSDVAKKLPAKMFHLYIELYVNGLTQEALADNWGFSPKYIQMLNKKLLITIQKLI